MNYIKIRLSGLIILTSILAFTIVHAAEESESVVEKIAVTTAQDYVAQHDNAIIMDVRTPAEFGMSHIPGAINVDVLNENFETMVAGLDKDKTYLVHCTKNPVGGRSSRALETLQSLGFRNLYNLEGGYIAWKESELPLIEADN